ncbi:hypothetical protein AXK12_04775 [Cephaloticoccus capnophilus]|uniref:Putative membrane protein insertion efficiency factor n=1 Tax=Cephaloticoccus capnophilus TaxID=1548208 RepID=A0A139SM79_9BACT|nr:membrane protein insertion efficiency factor YidD [Cephaloticoccus capnophilus]KXU35683.1 hypothetical protein AXK12_04775 [Cephaloticoccus capnophilus]
MNRFLKRAIRGLVRLPANGLLALVRLYQKTLSPVLPVIFGPACGCRFYPTCSHYAAEALQSHGALRGTWLALIRLLKCTPLHPGGLDPVPPPKQMRSGPSAARMSCTRVTHAPPFPTTLRTNG